MDAISISNLTKFYGKLKAVDNVSLKIPKGEFFAFLGPNGAGKTTIISCITGLSNITKGKIRVNGFDVVEQYRQARMQIGLSPQEFKFDGFFSIRDILIFQAGYFGIPKKEASKRADDMLKKFDLYEKRKETFHKLSGGMKRRLSIAKALIHEPVILMLDEPTAGLDVELRKELWKYIQKINKEGITIFLTTHYIEEAQQLADRIGIVNNGKIIELSKKKDILDKLGKKELSIITSNQIKIPEELRTFLKSQKNNETVFSFTKNNGITRQIFSFLQKSNAEILNVKSREESLEEIFLKLTHKEGKK